jgi:hypothetical protein
VLFGELLMRERRAEVSIALADQLERSASGRRGQPARTRLATLGRRQSRRAVGLERTVEPAHVPLGQPQELTSMSLGQSSLGESRHQLHPVQFLHTHRHMPRHAARVAQNRTFLNGRNRTSLYGSYSGR